MDTAAPLISDDSGTMLLTALAFTIGMLVMLGMKGRLSGLLGRLNPRRRFRPSQSNLVGRRAMVVSTGAGLRARVFDYSGGTHIVAAEADQPGDSFAVGDMIILTRRDRQTYRAVRETAETEAHPSA